MHALSRSFHSRPARLIVATLTLAVAAGFGQAAFAQPMGHGPGGPGGPGMELLGGRALEAIGASTDQITQIRSIFATARTDVKAQHDTEQTLRTQLRTVLLASSVDASAAENVRAQMAVVRESVSKRMLQAMVDAANVLTATQRAALAARMTKEQTLMNKQRAEREAAGLSR